MNTLTFKFTKTSGREQHTTLDRVHFVTPITDEERVKMAERYGKDTSGYHSPIKFFDTKHPMLAAETLEESRQAGISLVDVGQSQHALRLHWALSRISRTKMPSSWKPSMAGRSK